MPQIKGNGRECKICIHSRGVGLRDQKENGLEIAIDFHLYLIIVENHSQLQGDNEKYEHLKNQVF